MNDKKEFISLMLSVEALVKEYTIHNAPLHQAVIQPRPGKAPDLTKVLDNNNIRHYVESDQVIYLNF